MHGVMEKNFPFNYLDCPIYIGRKKLEYFDGMLTKVAKRLNGWQGKMLSYGGRVVLIKSILHSLPLYTLSAMSPPKGTFNLLKKYLARFFWGSTSDKIKYH